MIYANIGTTNSLKLACRMQQHQSSGIVVGLLV